MIYQDGKYSNKAIIPNIKVIAIIALETLSRLDLLVLSV
jgi:hypothetical protein